MEEIKWYKQSEDDIYNNPVDWSTSYYHIRMKDGTEHLLAVWLDEGGDGSIHEHYEFAGEDELVDLDEIELWRPANSNTDDLNKAAQEYSFMIPTQCEADSLWKRETEQHFKDGAIWDKEKIIKYLKELGYAITLNGDVISREEELKDMERYVKYQKEKLIEKACEWLKENAESYAVPVYKGSDLMDEATLCGDIVADFKKAMEE
jgi:hypothetical protein